MIAITRRELIVAVGSAGLASGATWTLRRPAGRLTVEAVKRPDPGLAGVPRTLRALTPAEYLTIVAASERVFPRDERPGATDLGVARYIDSALADIGARGWAEGFREGLSRLQSEAHTKFSMYFHLATPDEQDSLIKDWASGSDAANTRFIRALVTATLEGALGDPIYGGNTRQEGWRALALRVDPFAPSAV